LRRLCASAGIATVAIAAAPAIGEGTIDAAYESADGVAVDRRSDQERAQKPIFWEDFFRGFAYQAGALTARYGLMPIIDWWATKDYQYAAQLEHEPGAAENEGWSIEVYRVDGKTLPRLIFINRALGWLGGSLNLDGIPLRLVPTDPVAGCWCRFPGDASISGKEVQVHTYSESLQSGQWLPSKGSSTVISMILDSGHLSGVSNVTDSNKPKDQWKTGNKFQTRIVFGATEKAVGNDPLLRRD
jgi:hypothetical protein